MKTVAQLIFDLSRFPGDMPVVSPGFDELGYCDAAVTIEQVNFTKRRGGSSYDYEPAESTVDAVCVSFGSQEPGS